jgi:hypothetical protein
MKQVKIFNGLNIRKGLEMEIPVSKIFKVNTESDGNILAMDIFVNEIEDVKNLKKTDLKILEQSKDNEVCYVTKSEYFKLNNNLDAYVREIYIANLEFKEEEKTDIPKIEYSKFIEIDFVNTEKLDFQSFLKNIMKAQEFSGAYKNDFNFRFIGIGDFGLEEYLKVNDIILYSNMELLNFFIFDNKILCSIGNLLIANYKKDIEEQKTYLTEEEYPKLINMVDQHKSIIKKGFMEFLNMFNNPKSSSEEIN